MTLLPIFEHGLQFRFNEITYFMEHLFIGYTVLKWSNLEFSFEVGGSLVAADAMSCSYSCKDTYWHKS